MPLVLEKLMPVPVETPVPVPSPVEAAVVVNTVGLGAGAGTALTDGSDRYKERAVTTPSAAVQEENGRMAATHAVR